QHVVVSALQPAGEAPEPAFEGIEIVVDDLHPRSAAGVTDMAADVETGPIELGCCRRGRLQHQLAPWLGNLGRLRGAADARCESKKGNSHGRDKGDRPRPRARRLVARNNRQTHGGRPRPLDSSPVTTAEDRPMRAPRTPEDDVFRQVSWLAGHHPSPPSQALTAQWQLEEGLAADSCGGSSGFDWPARRPIAPDSLLADQRDRRT